MNGPIPGYVRVVGTMAGALTTLFMAVPMVAGALALNGVTASADTVQSFPASAPPEVEVQSGAGKLLIEPGAAGAVVVEEHASATALTRQDARAALEQARPALRHDGGRVLVRATSAGFRPLAFSWHSLLVVRVPPNADLKVSADSTSLDVRGFQGRLRLAGRSGAVRLEGATLTGDSELAVTGGELALDGVRVSGRTHLSAESGHLRFQGSLAPGGSTLDMEVKAGVAEIFLPRPTDARAVVVTSRGLFQSDDAWGFTETRTGGTRTATADLGPNPSGTVSVTADLGSVQFRVS